MEVRKRVEICERAQPDRPVFCSSFGCKMFNPAFSIFLGVGLLIAGAVLIWLVLSVTLSLVACAWPARRAMRVPSATALNYE